MKNETLNRLFRYKAWANDALLNGLAALDVASPVTHLAIKALSHSHVVDRIFIAHMRRSGHQYTSANLGQLPGLEDLAKEIRATDRELVDYVTALDGSRLDEWIDFTFTDGKAGRMTREEMLMHLITHGVGHRGQVSAVMLLNAVAPATDGFTTWLHESEPVARGRNV